MKPSAFGVLYWKGEIFIKNRERLSVRGQVQTFLIKGRERGRESFAALQRMLFGEDCACEPHWHECGCKRYQHGRDRGKGISVCTGIYGEKGEFPNSGIRRLTGP